MIILTVAAVVSIILGVAVPTDVNSSDSGWIDGVAILVAVIIVAVVTVRVLQISSLAESCQTNLLIIDL